MRIAAILGGIPAAITLPGLLLFTVGEIAAITAFLALISATVSAAFVPRRATVALLAVFALATLGAVGFGGYHGYQLATAIADTSGPVDPPEQAVLTRAEEKIEAVENDAAFRIRLTEQELTSLVQESLQDTESPLRRVDVDIVSPEGGGPGSARFEAAFKSGGLTATGEVGYTVRAGEVEIDIRNVEAGAFSVPGVVRRALEDLVAQAADLNEALSEFSVSVQSLELADNAVVVIGTQGEGTLLTSQTLVAGLRERAAAISTRPEPLAERLGPGQVNGREAAGDRYYVALGDSLAASVGVAEARDGYVSRLHRQLGLRDGRSYGLRNFGVSGETSGTLARGGQLDAALEFIGANDVAYITLDIGANDIIPHLGSQDCAAGVETPACADRIAASLESYRETLGGILDRLTEAAPGATVAFLLTYNPFSFGSDLDFERETHDVTGELNAVAAALARERGVLVADGFTPLTGRAAAATRMTETPPDIHPRAAGHDALAAALLDAMSAS